ncbi:MAG: hypothetical protein AAFV80_00980 [Bacteroidota bacterium]
MACSNIKDFRFSNLEFIPAETGLVNQFDLVAGEALLGEFRISATYKVELSCAQGQYWSEVGTRSIKVKVLDLKLFEYIYKRPEILVEHHWF